MRRDVGVLLHEGVIEVVDSGIGIVVVDGTMRHYCCSVRFVWTVKKAKKKGCTKECVMSWVYVSGRVIVLVLVVVLVGFFVWRGRRRWYSIDRR